MALALTQVITEDRSSGAQVIDGSLKFVHGNTQYLERTPGSAGNRRTFTWSAWIKRGDLGAYHSLFCGAQDSSNLDYFFFWTDDRLALRDYNGTTYDVISTAKFRDPSAWYHIVLSVDTTQSTAANRVRFYVNSTELTDFDTSTYPAQNYDFHINNTDEQYVGYNRFNEHDGLMSQVYFVDGQQLAPTEFGFTDPLTGTWRPKKYTGTFGTNGFYLPMDGNSLIGEDKSGNGNDFTPVNFGGTNSIEKATGALPILNTTNGGKVATVGVRTDSNFSGLGLALPLVGTENDVSNQVNGGSTTKTITKGNNVDADPERFNFYGGSHRFNGSTDYLDVAASSDFAFGTGDFTVECWIYSGVNSLDTYYRRIYMTDGPTGNATGNFQIAITPTSGVINLWETSGQLDVSGTTNVTDQKWNHIAAVRSGTTLKLYVNGVEELSTTYSTSVTANSGSPRPRIGNYDGGSGGGDFDGYMQDLRVYKGLAKYTSDFIPASTNPDILPDTPSGVANGSALATLSESTTGGSVYFDGSADYLSLANSTDFDVAAGDFTAEGYFYFTNQSSTGTCFFAKWANTPGRNYGFVHIKSDNKYRFSWSSNGTDETLYTTSVGYPGDVNRWVHLAVVRNGTTLKIYRDGEEILSSSIGSSTIYNSSTSFMVGRFESNTNYDYSGWISNFRFVKGTAVYTAEFTPPTSPLSDITNTKLLCCKNSSSATASDVTPGTITANGTPRGDKFRPFQGEDINLVRGQESGYATLNPIFGVGRQDQLTYSDGNLKVRSAATTGNDTTAVSTLAVKGKIYCEFNLTESGVGAYVGVMKSNTALTTSGVDTTASSDCWLIRGDNGNKANGDGGSGASYGSAFTTGDLIMMAVDIDRTAIWWGKNGVWFASGNPEAGSNAAYTNLPSTDDLLVMCGDNYSSETPTIEVNFGQKPFKYAPPEGFKTLCLANLPRPTSPAAIRPDKYFQTILYTGNNSTQTITGGLNFSPDFIWAKNRDTAGYHHDLYDRVRGDNLRIYSSQTNAEGTGYLQFSDGNEFTLTSGGGINASGDAHVAWCWKAGTSYTPTVTGGFSSPSASINREAGFGIYKVTGSNSQSSFTTGLNQQADFIICKNLDNTYNWAVYHRSHAGNAPSVKLLHLNSSTVPSDKGTNIWVQTGTTIEVDSYAETGSTGDYVYYVWHSVPGYSKIGSYTGNGATTDGPFVYCGFRPSWVMWKRNGADGWVIKDSVRNTYNTVSEVLYANLSNSESSTQEVDFLSNGFKIRTNSGASNTSGNTYYYMAFAEAPTNNLFGGQANAR